MCLLIKKPANVKFSATELENFYDYNPDGFGMMYAENNSLKINRSVGDFRAFMRAYSRIEHKDLLIHFRQATHGDIHAKNSHPYPVIVRGDYQLWLMHNGILSHGNASDRTRSDTYCFIKEVLAPLLDAEPTIAFSPKFLATLGRIINNSNKFALADSLGNVGLVNEKSGTDFKGAWLSNLYAWDSYGLGGIGQPAKKQDWRDYSCDFELDDRDYKDDYERSQVSSIVDTRKTYEYQMIAKPKVKAKVENKGTWDFKLPSMLLKGI